MKQFYVARDFKPQSIEFIETVNGIVDEYIEQGFIMTVRQIYYQIVARGLFPEDRRWKWTGSKWVRDPNGTDNADPNYKWLCSLVNDARLAGLMDWDAIEDRTRSLVRRNRYTSGKDVLEIAAQAYHMDMWEDQEWRVFCIVEKEALAGVLERTCTEMDIPLLAAKGYPSVSVLREFAISDLLPTMGYDREFQRLEGTPEKKFLQKFMILHLGDHDPSGIDMSNDLTQRLGLFCGMKDGLPEIFFERIALNMSQIEEQKPPENPTKMTDARAKKYVEKFGDSSWELDALKPDYLHKLIRTKALPYINNKKWKARKAQIEFIRERIQNVAEEFA